MKGYKLVKNRNAINYGVAVYKLTCLLSIAGFIVACTSYLFSGENKSYFALLYFYIPLLWIMWIACNFFIRERGSLLKLFLLWQIINFTILTILASFSLGVVNFYQSKGMDSTMLIIYFPVVFPLGLFFVNFSLPALNLGAYFGYSGINGAIAVWLEMSLLAALQSILIMFICNLALRKKSIVTDSIDPKK